MAVAQRSPPARASVEHRPLQLVRAREVAFGQPHEPPQAAGPGGAAGIAEVAEELERLADAAFRLGGPALHERDPREVLQRPRLAGGPAQRVEHRAAPRSRCAPLRRCDRRRAPPGCGRAAPRPDRRRRRLPRSAAPPGRASPAPGRGRRPAGRGRPGPPGRLRPRTRPPNSSANPIAAAASSAAPAASRALGALARPADEQGQPRGGVLVVGQREALGAQPLHRREQPETFAPRAHLVDPVQRPAAHPTRELTDRAEVGEQLGRLTRSGGRAGRPCGRSRCLRAVPRPSGQPRGASRPGRTW